MIKNIQKNLKISLRIRIQTSIFYYCKEQHFYQFELCFVFLNSEKVKKEVLSFFIFWHRVIFPQDFPYSIVTAVEFHHQIRNGLVWFLYAQDTRISNHERRHERKTYWLMNDCEAPILDCKGHQRPLPALRYSIGQSFWCPFQLFFNLVI